MKRINMAKPSGKAKVGQKVYIPELDLYGEVVEIHNDVSNLITQVKVKGKDGYSFVEVTSLVVQAVQIVEKVGSSNVFKAVVNFFQNLFGGKKN